MPSKKATPAIAGTLNKEEPTTGASEPTYAGGAASGQASADPDEIIGDSIGRILARVNFAMRRLNTNEDRLTMLRQLVAALEAEKDFVIHGD